MPEPECVVRVDSWDDLPEILEPCVYYVAGRRYTVLEPVPKRVILKAIEYCKPPRHCI